MVKNWSLTKGVLVFLYEDPFLITTNTPFMKFIKPKEQKPITITGATRLVKFFAWRPVTISFSNREETRWLEKVCILQRFEHGEWHNWIFDDFSLKNRK